MREGQLNGVKFVLCHGVYSQVYTLSALSIAIQSIEFGYCPTSQCC